jgi:hypothetical protein
MAYPVKTQIANSNKSSQGEFAARIAEQIEGELGPYLFKADPTTGYAGSASIITEIIAAMLRRPLGTTYMTNAALANIVTACTDA